MARANSHPRDKVARKERAAIPRRIVPTTQDIAWAAGVYEGEGNVYWNQRGLIAQVTQKDFWLPFRLRDLFGGTIRYQNPTRTHKNGFYNWLICSARAAGFVMTIYKFLSDRRKEQVSYALSQWRAWSATA